MSAISFPISAFGKNDRRLRRYIAGMAETKRIPSPPEAVAAVWTVQFSFGPKGPPRKRPRMPDSGRILERGLRMA